MGHQRLGASLLSLARSFNRLDASDPVTQCLAPRLTRGFATPTDLPLIDTPINIPGQNILKPKAKHTNPNVDPSLYEHSKVLTTVYSWPTLEPVRYTWYKSHELDMPLRKDLLHRAVIYEADGSRQGTAWAPHRTDIKGSNRKIRPQKGTGQARLGDKKSPMLKGGGVAHGPKPRDFSTELQAKIYDKAWRMALSHRYRLGELFVIDGQIQLEEEQGSWFLDNFFRTHGWGAGQHRSMLVMQAIQPQLEDAMSQLGKHAKLKDMEDVDVKDLLSLGRLVIEKNALDSLLNKHSRDLK